MSKSSKGYPTLQHNAKSPLMPAKFPLKFSIALSAVQREPAGRLLAERNATHPRNTLTVPRMSARHTAQLRNAGEQVSQQTRCPQGRNTVLTSRSMHTLHVLASRSRRFSNNSASQSATTHRSDVLTPVYAVLNPQRNRQGSNFHPISWGGQRTEITEAPRGWGMDGVSPPQPTAESAGSYRRFSWNLMARK